MGQLTSAQADIRNTYNGAECVSVQAAQAQNLSRSSGVRNSSTAVTEVVCPVVKAIFNSTARVSVAVAASGGTNCRLESYDVFTLGRIVSLFRTFPGAGVTGIEFTVPSSLRGAMQMRCFLQAGDEIRNYLAREH
jgi:hypothetical protein